jgi:hypothetical protein
VFLLKEMFKLFCISHQVSYQFNLNLSPILFLKPEVVNGGVRDTIMQNVNK